MESQVSRDERLAVIENVLFHNPDGLRVVELADICGVDRRTIYRDIAKLRANGVPIYQERGRFYVSREHYHASVQLTLNETLALFTAVRVMSQLAEQQNPYAVAALTKLSAGLPEPIAAHVAHIAAILRQQPVDRLQTKIMNVLVHAWSEQRWVRIWTAQGDTALEITPYFLEATLHGNVYLVGMVAQTRTVRSFRVERILRAELLNRPAATKDKSSPTPYLADVTGIVRGEGRSAVFVKLALKQELARWLLAKRLLTEAQEQPGEDGRVVISLRVADWKDLLPWLRSLGANVEVIQPRALRDAISQEAQQIANLYKDTADSDTPPEQESRTDPHIK